MKFSANLLIVFSIFLLCFAASCAKQREPGSLQEIAFIMKEECQASSLFHVGFKQLSEVWCADYEILSEERNRLYIRAESLNGMLVQINLTDYVNGNYALDGDRNQIVINRFGNIFQSQNTMPGSLDILEYSPVERLLGGNFTFTAINYASGEQQFIQGSFRVQYY